MGPSIRIDETLWTTVRAHLLRDGMEQAAMMFAAVHETDVSLDFSVREVELLQGSDFDHQSAIHISLTDETSARLIKRAWNSRLAMIEVHSHRGRLAIPEFSPSDRRGFVEFVPHVRWRLRGAPYAALVITESGFDALAWIGTGTCPVQVHHVHVGHSQLQPSRLTMGHKEGASYG